MWFVTNTVGNRSGSQGTVCGDLACEHKLGTGTRQQKLKTMNYKNLTLE